MKKETKLTTILLAICLLLVSATSLQASTRASNDKISKIVRNRMTYPSGLTPISDKAIVMISFQVEPCGTVNILDVNASDESFKKYVVEKISAMHFESQEEPGIIYLKFSFHHQE